MTDPKAAEMKFRLEIDDETLAELGRLAGLTRELAAASRTIAYGFESASRTFDEIRDVCEKIVERRKADS